MAMAQPQDRELKTAFIYMIISVILMIAGAIYEHFSFGVYSYFMIYAFAIPLAGGALPFLAKYMKGMRGANSASGTVTAATAAVQSGYNAGDTYRNGDTAGSSHKHEAIYHLALATLTAGSIVHGILAICGRPNSLTVIYLITGILLLAVAALGIIRNSAQRRCE